MLKFSTLAGAFSSRKLARMSAKSSDRCFRFDANGNAEYTFFADHQQ